MTSPRCFRRGRRLLLAAALGIVHGLGPGPQALAAQAAAEAVAPAGAGPAVIRLHYQERPPYSSADGDGQPAGLLVGPVHKALKAAGLQATWHLTPAQRQLALVQQGRGADCGLGWFRSAERAALGRFSKAIYRDRPYVAVLRSDQAASAPNSLEALLADPSRSLLVKAGYSYGPAIDAALPQARAPVQATSAEPLQMARMVVAGRAGWLLMAGEEADYLMALPEFARGVLASQALAGQTSGPTRHLYCNFVVGEDWLRRFDRALAVESRP